MTRKILKGKNNINHNCPVCNNKKWDFFTKRSDGIAVYKCLICSLYVRDRFWEKHPNEYEQEYFKKKNKNRSIGYIDYEKMPEFEFFWQFALLKLFAPQVESVLDLGSGLGKFLEVLRIEGIKGQGVDVSNFASNIVKEKGFINIKTLDVEKKRLPMGNFNAVTAWDLIEHLNNPLGFLKKVKNIFKKGSSFIFTTPCANDKNVKWFNLSLEHNLYFTKRSLQLLIKKVFNEFNFKSGIIRINFGGKQSGQLSTFICIIQKNKVVNKRILKIIRTRKLTGNEKVDYYLRIIFAHFFRDQEKGHFFRTKGVLGNLLNLSLKFRLQKWCTDDSVLFNSYNPYLKSYHLIWLKNLNLVIKREIKAKEAHITNLEIKISELQLQLKRIYQSKTWHFLTLYQGLEKKIKSLNKMLFWQNILLNLKNNLKTILKPVDYRKAYTLDIFYFPIIDWYFRFQRPQQICLEMAKCGHQIFYIKPTWIVIPNQSLTKEQIAEKVSIKKIAPNIFEVRLVNYRQLNIYKDSLSSKDIQYLIWSLDAVRQKVQARQYLAMIAFPFWYPLIPNHWRLFYDCLDALSGFTNVNKNNLILEKKLITKADMVVYSSQQLLNKFKILNPHSLLIKNATDFNHFSQNPKNIPSDIKSLNSPIVGYYGAIADWFNDELIAFLATEKPLWQFVFIGHIMGAKVDKLKTLPNIHFLREKSYQELPAYLYQFDCFIIPFKLNKLIKATNPVKVYEVLSSGKPIISTNLPELKPMKNLLYLANDKKEFLANTEKALKENRLKSSLMKTLINQRIAFAKNNTWKHRTQQLIWAINKDIYPKVSVVIISYNTFPYLKLCLQSIYRYSNYPNLELIVVDNNSQDKTANFLQNLKRKDNNLKIIISRKNLGFAGGNNWGIKRATGEFLILLNSDTIVTTNWVTNLIKYLKRPKVGLVGPVTNWVGNEAKINLSYRNLKQMHQEAKKYTQSHQGKSFAIPMLAFYCIAFRKSLFDKIGPLDKQFKVGFFEDDDYCRRVRLAGYKIICAEDVFIHHFGNQSFKKLSPEEKKKIFKKNKNKFEKKWKINWTSHKYRKF